MEVNPKLKDDNYYRWSYDIQMTLKSKNLWKNCEYESIGEYRRSMMDKSGKDEKEIITNQERMKWLEDDDKCIAIIGKNVSERFIPIIKNARTAHHAWVNITQEFAGYNNAL